MLAKLPTTSEKSVVIFEYLFSRLNEFRQAHWEQLQKTPFIPIFNTAESTKGDEKQQASSIRYALVSDILIKPQGSSWQAYMYDNIFDYVDFGTNGNLFLKNCGVKEDPSPEQFAAAIKRNYQRYLSKNGVQRYLELLSIFSSVFPRLPTNFVKALAATPFCLAYLFEEKEDDTKQLQKDDESFMVHR